MKAIKARPLGNRVIVKVDEAPKETAGGIIIPDTAKDKPGIGNVVAVGPGKHDEPMELAVGDRVKFSSFSGQELEIDGTNYLLMQQSEILVVLPE